MTEDRMSKMFRKISLYTEKHHPSAPWILIYTDLMNQALYCVCICVRVCVFFFFFKCWYLCISKGPARDKTRQPEATTNATLIERGHTVRQQEEEHPAHFSVSLSEKRISSFLTFRGVTHSAQIQNNKNSSQTMLVRCSHIPYPVSLVNSVRKCCVSWCGQLIILQVI